MSSADINIFPLKVFSPSETTWEGLMKVSSSGELTPKSGLKYILNSSDDFLSSDEYEKKQKSQKGQ